MEASNHSGGADVRYLLNLLQLNPTAVEVWRQQSPIAALMSPEFASAINQALGADDA
jgi:hypothetical protein